MSDQQPSLSSLIGKRINIKIPLWKENAVMSLTLVGVEAGGIWVESEQFMEEFFADTPHKMTQTSVQVFVPFAQILAIYHFGGGPWISEKVAQ